MVNAIIIAIYAVAILTVIIKFGKWAFFLILGLISIPGTFIFFNALCIKYPLISPLVGALAIALAWFFMHVAMRLAEKKK